MLTLNYQLLNHVMGGYTQITYPQQLGALHILYNQRRHVHRIVSIYVVLPQQFIQKLEQISIQGDQKIFRIILH